MEPNAPDPNAPPEELNPDGTPVIRASPGDSASSPGGSSPGSSQTGGSGGPGGMMTPGGGIHKFKDTSSLPEMHTLKNIYNFLAVSIITSEISMAWTDLQIELKNGILLPKPHPISRTIDVGVISKS